MNNIKDQENLNQKKVLLRLDLNVPLKNGIIKDQTRIEKILPIINFLLKKQSKIIIISHVGRPKGKVNEDLSLKPICENLEKKINKKIICSLGSLNRSAPHSLKISSLMSLILWLIFFSKYSQIGF